MRFCVVGGGILGLATARLLLREVPGADVILLEKETAVAAHQTGRNSGVVHAGVYYAPGSLKARLCREGVALLEAYCAEQGLPYERCGKVVVATAEHELPRLQELHRRSVGNGVPGIRMLTATELRELEPHAAGIAALHSPSTAITDYGAVARAMADEIVAAGGAVRLGVRVARVEASANGRRTSVVLANGSWLECDRAIICAGLQSDRVARSSGAAADPRIVPFRGEYFALREDRTELVRGLIYPVPDPALPFLGIHLTRRVGGGVLVGPNAVLALGRESYGWRQVSGRDLRELVTWAGTWRLMRRQWRTGATEMRRSMSVSRFAREAQRYVPALAPGDLVRAPAGVRAQAVDHRGRLIDDFVLEQGPGTAWVRNAPSPAATSAMAIAQELLERLGVA